MPSVSTKPVAVSTSASLCTKECIFGTFNNKTCKCECSNQYYSGEFCEVFDCAKIPADAKDCVALSCTEKEVVPFCPKKCLCAPSTTTKVTTTKITGACLSCYNGGILDVVTCSCKCIGGFNGDRCQISADPCNNDDPVECASLNCWTGGEDVLYKCQKKCLCCGNLQCKNLGELFKNTDTDKCECKCFDDQVYDENKLCDIKECRDVLPACGEDLNSEYCDDPFVATACPLMCGDCEP